MSDEVKQETVEPNQTEQLAANLANLLAAFPNAPSQDQITEWKKQHGDVFVSGFSETEVYIWRPVTRPEYIKIQTRLQEPNSPINQFQLEEIVCETCVLWKSVDVAWDKGKAGTPQALSEQIMQNSNFLSPQAASMLVVKL